MNSVHGLFDPASSTLTYVVWDAVTRDAVVIDPVLDFDPATQITAQSNLDKLKLFVNGYGLRVHWILDTHAHADHLSGAPLLKREWPGALWGVSAALSQVFENFKKVFAWPASVELKKLGVDRWFEDGEEFSAGSLRVSCLATPGHTPACMTYKIGGAIFTGDAIFMPDGGTGRCDFPGGSASTLYDSIWGKLYALPDSTRVFVGHDYQPGGRPLRFQTTIGEQKRSNIHLHGGVSKAEFVAFREARDKTLTAPRLLNPSLDWNLGARQLVKGELC
jgi:glyoxylase-like metal-dependent hydrolase (beta-lactamase superfamily II)